MTRSDCRKKMLCSICTAELSACLGSAKGDSNSGRRRHGKDLHEGRQQRCIVCSHLASHLEKSNGQPFGAERYVWSIIEEGSIQFYHSNFTKFITKPILIIETSNDFDKKQGFPVSLPESLNNSSAENELVVGRARFWLNECLGDHKCESDRQPSYCPPRLLDLTQSKPRLIETAYEKPPGPYVALSHCWGKNPNHIILSTDNIKDFMEGFDIRLLPPSFRDSIEVCRGLGIFRLWIDSLCIIQDGMEHTSDWRKHVSEMAEIYSNCILNISISHAANAGVGCFRSRDLASIATWSSDPKVSLNTQNVRLTMIPSHSIAEDIESWPLRKRGWAFQERLLAPRTLHFGRDQAYWECSSHSLVCEYVPRSSRRTTSIAQSILGPFDWRYDPATSYPLAHWNSIVKSYSARNLTHATDLFPALAGLAERMATVLNDDYITGFFRRQLPCGLLWIVTQSAKRYRGQYRSPSWSWASIEGSVKPYNCHSCNEDDALIPSNRPHSSETDAWPHLLAGVEGLNIDLIDKSNRYGQVRSALLVLSASPIPVTFNMIQVPGGDHLRYAGMPTVCVFQVRDGSFNILSLSSIAVSLPYKLWFFQVDDVTDILIHQPAFVLFISQEAVHATRFDRRIKGLVIQSKADGQPTTYSRIGTIEIEVPSDLKYSKFVERHPNTSVTLI